MSKLENCVLFKLTIIYFLLVITLMLFHTSLLNITQNYPRTFFFENVNISTFVKSVLKHNNHNL